jgi:hypothetical protein
MPLTTDQLVLVKCSDLETGMFVAELDRSWLHTPFTSDGFLITLPSQIEALRHYCDYVYVDSQRSEPDIRSHLSQKPPLHHALTRSQHSHEPPALNLAREALHDANILIDCTVHEARRNGQIKLEPIFLGLTTFLDSTLQDSDGMQWLLATEPIQGFLNRRALGTSMLCILFGQHLGLDRHELMNLALGGLLLDIGKVSVPITILANPNRLSPEGKWFTTRHVRQSLDMMQFNGHSLDRVFSMIAAHHERMDGSGYPNQIGGTDIPLYARIAGIVDTFDALTLNRRYASARSGYSALRFVSALRRSKFDAALVDEFIDSIGIYPTGTRVRLDDGSTGLVMSQNDGRPRQPNVLLTSDTIGRPFKKVKIVTVGTTQPITQAFPTLAPR